MLFPGAMDIRFPWGEAVVIALLSLVAVQKGGVRGETAAFSFDSFSTRNLTLLGDCFIKNGYLGLSRETEVPASSVGRALYNTPVRFHDPATNTFASFQTSFSFSVTNLYAVRGGDGLAFIIVPDNSTLGSSGGWLGVMNSTSNGNSSSAHAIAVELDTYLDVNFFDINDNHVGLDINSLHSVAAADLGSVQMDLKSGDVITAWIDYNSSRGELEVRLSYTGQRPLLPLLAANVSLSSFLHEFMYVGFSASTEGSQELHSVYTWSFSSSGLATAVGPNPSLPLPPAPSPIAPDASHIPVGAPNASHYEVGAPNSSSVPQLVVPVSPRLKHTKCKSPRCLGVGAFIGISVGAAFLLALVILLVAWGLYRYWKAMRRQRSSRLNNLEIRRPRRFTYRELSVATKGFGITKVIGNGAFGTVYKGVLADTGTVVAVKRSIRSNQGKNEFLAELSTIGCLRHRNLVQLLGWCHEKGEILLVYDYMPQGSLDKLLFNNNATVLSWPYRCKIVMGVASALAYLHCECEQQVVHRDVKASNIMLDASFNARLGDFGLARLTEHNKSPDATLAAGTMGYLAPEYIHTGKASEKTDVFSFGAVLLEVACGRRPLERDLSPSENVLVDWVWGLHRYGRLLDAADPRLRGDFDEEEMIRVLQVGLLCSHPDPSARPSMRQVLQILTGEAPLPPLPRHKPTPSFAMSLPLSLQDIISESGQSSISSPPDSF